jgi:hypothetical protein
MLANLVLVLRARAHAVRSAQARPVGRRLAAQRLGQLGILLTWRGRSSSGRTSSHTPGRGRRSHARPPARVLGFGERVGRCCEGNIGHAARRLARNASVRGGTDGVCVCLLLALWRGRSYNGRESAVRCTRTPKKSCNILKQLNEMKRVNTWERQRQTAGRLARSASMRIIMAAARLAGGLSCLRTGRLLLPAGLRVGGWKESRAVTHLRVLNTSHDRTSVCVFELARWRWALNDRLAPGYLHARAGCRPLRVG